MAKCCVVFIYDLYRKSRWAVVILTSRFGGEVLCCTHIFLRQDGKVLCCIHIGLRQKIRINCCDFDFKILWQVLCCIHIWLRQEIQMDCCDFDFKIWRQSVVLYSYIA